MTPSELALTKRALTVYASQRELDQARELLAVRHVVSARDLEITQLLRRIGELAAYKEMAIRDHLQELDAELKALPEKWTEPQPAAPPTGEQSSTNAKESHPCHP